MLLILHIFGQFLINKFIQYNKIIYIKEVTNQLNIFKAANNLP